MEDPIRIVEGNNLNPDPDIGLVKDPPVEESAGGLFSNEVFQERVAVIKHAIEDPEKHRQAIAEIHTYLSMFDEGIRAMMTEMQNSGGPMGLFRKMMGR